MHSAVAWLRCQTLLFLRLTLLAALLTPSMGAYAAGVGWEWLSRMNDAVRTQTYTGTALMRSGDRVETLRIAHRYRQGDEQERIVSLSGERREVLRRDGEVRVLLPDQGLMIVETDPGRGLLPVLGEAAVQDLDQHYSVTVLAQSGRVASRATRQLRIEPRDNWRWGYMLELDRDTAMPLELRVLGPQGVTLEHVQFVELSMLDMIADAELESAIDHQKLEVVRADIAPPDPQQAAPFQSWDVAQPPPGFRLSTRTWTTLPGLPQAVAHWVYSDGLATVSIYVSPRNQQVPIPPSQMADGAVSTVRRYMQDISVTTMGEVPLQTARRFTQSLGPAAEPSR